MEEQEPKVLLKFEGDDDIQYNDLYFYCLDNNFFNDEDGLTKGLLNFISMLINWKEKIRKMIVGDSSFLPFDFSDQYIGFIHLYQYEQECVNVTYCFTINYLGCLINPSTSNSVDLLDAPYKEVGPTYPVKKEELLQDIDSAIKCFFEGLYKDIA
nr:hypothetical protein [uncultured Arsenicibacter sp.]